MTEEPGQEIDDLRETGVVGFSGRRSQAAGVALYPDLCFWSHGLVANQRFNPHSPQVMDAEQFRVAGKQMVDFIADYLETIRDRPVLPSVQPLDIKNMLPAEAPEQGEPFEEIFADIERIIMPGVSN